MRAFLSAPLLMRALIVGALVNARPFYRLSFELALFISALFDGALIIANYNCSGFLPQGHVFLHGLSFLPQNVTLLQTAVYQLLVALLSVLHHWGRT